MLCPKCASEKTEVVSTVKGSINERYHKCIECGYGFITLEIVKVDVSLIEYANEINKSYVNYFEPCKKVV
ncbi:MAG: hypothetical protein LBI78_04275 [Campylobacteraceae bacterium]|jgi:transcriptional repressor NrdR|nr:hypothetical protein [Campylobacteraceae bacterium]